MFSFKLTDDFVSQYETREVPWGGVDGGGNSVGEISFLRTYFRLKEDGSKETWVEVCRRVVEGMYSIQKNYCLDSKLPWNGRQAQTSAREAFERLFVLKWCPPGRGLWMMGTPFVMEKKNSAALQNCAFVSTAEMTADDPSAPFRFLMEASMLGIGVGFDAKGKDKGLKIYSPLANDLHPRKFVIEDSREGWVDSTAAIIDSHLKPNQANVECDYSLVRGPGEIIKGFGGVSSGPEPLIKLHTMLKALFFTRTGCAVNTELIADIANLIGVCVVSGNVRRSAEIMLGDADDDDFINLKNPKMFPARNGVNPELPGWGWMSNNSVYATVGMDYSPYIDSIALNGEPGFAWMDVVRKFGRLADPADNKDFRAVGFNPCQPAWAPVLTPRGIAQLGDVNPGDLIWSETGWTRVINKWSTGIKSVYAHTTNAGVFYGTEDHRLVSGGVKIPAKDCESVDILRGQTPYQTIPFLNSQDIMDGIVFGDGSVHAASNNLVHLFIGTDDFDYHTSEIKHLIGRERPGIKEKAWEVSTTITADELPKTYLREVPARFFYGTPAVVRAFLRGLYTANGSVVSDRVTLKAASRKVITQVQQMLSSIGISSYVTTNKAHDVEHANGVYMSRESYDLNTSQTGEFARLVGFIQQDKVARLPVKLSGKGKTTYDIVSREYLGDEEVFDITVDNVPHTYWSGGLNVSNCAEQPLESRECCTLVETFISRHESLEDFKRTLKFSFLYAKTVTLMPTHWPETNAIMQRNRRIGCSLSGVAEMVDKVGLPEVTKWFEAGYQEVQRRDRQYSEWLCIRESIRTTTGKPSGTVSLGPWVTPGFNYSPGGGEYILRTIRMAQNEPLVTLLQGAGYRIEPDVTDPTNTSVVYFPIHQPHIKDETEVSIFEKIHLAAVGQQYWSDNSISITVTFDPETEKKHLETVLRMYEGKLKSVSFLPKGNQVYQQMPYQQITKEEYEEYSRQIRKVDFAPVYAAGSSDALGELFCTTVSCEIPKR